MFNISHTADILMKWLIQHFSCFVHGSGILHAYYWVCYLCKILLLCLVKITNVSRSVFHVFGHLFFSLFLNMLPLLTPVSFAVPPLLHMKAASQFTKMCTSANYFTITQDKNTWIVYYSWRTFQYITEWCSTHTLSYNVIGLSGESESRQLCSKTRST